MIEGLGTGRRNRLIQVREIDVLPPVYFCRPHLTFLISVLEEPATLTQLLAGGQTLVQYEDYFYRDGQLYFSPKSFEGAEIDGYLSFEKDGQPISYKFKLTKTDIFTTALDSLEQQVENYKAMTEAIIEFAQAKGHSQQAIEYLNNALDDYLWKERIAALDYLEYSLYSTEEESVFVAKYDRVGKVTFV